jgi:hypothetical protein
MPLKIAVMVKIKMPSLFVMAFLLIFNDYSLIAVILTAALMVLSMIFVIATAALIG